MGFALARSTKMAEARTVRSVKCPFIRQHITIPKYGDRLVCTLPCVCRNVRALLFSLE